METSNFILNETGTILVDVEKSVRTVVVPPTVTEIGKGAFRLCTNLESVIIGESVTIIDAQAFWGCKSLKSVIMSKKIEKIGCCAFYGCSSLKSILIPESVKVIEDGTFYGCSSLEKVSLPQSLEQIGKSAFQGCLALGEITIPALIREIGHMAFCVCPSLKTIRCMMQNPAQASIDSKAFDSYTYRISTVVVPSRKAYERDRNFRKFEKMIIDNLILDETGTLIKGVKDMDERTITIPSTVREIGKGAFDDYVSLREVICDVDDPAVIVFHENPFSTVTVNNGTVFIKTGTMKKYYDHEHFKMFMSKNRISIYPRIGLESGLPTMEM